MLEERRTDMIDASKFEYCILKEKDISGMSQLELGPHRGLPREYPVRPHCVTINLNGYG